MSRRFFRCPHCNLPHEAGVEACPTTGLAIPKDRPSRPPGDRSSGKIPVVPFPSPSPATTSSLPPAPPPSADAMSLVGRMVDNMYLVRGVIGRGGMATVYDAEQVTMQRPVALKVLTVDKRQSAESHKRLLREAQAAASLLHPNVCQVYDFGTLPDGSPYIAMERLVGEPLSARMEREGALPFVDTIDILMQVLAGLSAAHKKGLVHRDVKPDNVFLVRREGKSPIVKLLDFGVATSARMAEAPGDDTTQITRTGVVMGTPYYMAPEQAFGDRNFDGRVDLFSVGVILYECITGKRPFSSLTHQGLLTAILSDTPRPAREIRPQTPPEVDLVIEKATAKQREARYQSALEMIGDLQRLRTIVHQGGFA